MATQSLGQRLKYYRNQANLSQKAVAEALNVSDSAISKYEQDKRNLTPEMLKSFADLYDVSLDTLLDVETNTKTSQLPITIKAPYKAPSSKTTIIFSAGFYLGLILMLIGIYETALIMIVAFGFALMSYHLYHYFLHEGKITHLKLVDKNAQIHYSFEPRSVRKRYLNDLLFLSFFVFLSVFMMVLIILPLSSDLNDVWTLFFVMVMLNLHLGYMVYVWYKRIFKKFLPEKLKHREVNHRLNTYKWIVFHWIHILTLTYFVLSLGYVFTQTNQSFTLYARLFYISTIVFYFIFTQAFIFKNNSAHHAYQLTTTGQNGQ